MIDLLWWLESVDVNCYPFCCFQTLLCTKHKIITLLQFYTLLLSFHYQNNKIIIHLKHVSALGPHQFKNNNNKNKNLICLKLTHVLSYFLALYVQTVVLELCNDVIRCYYVLWRSQRKKHMTSTAKDVLHKKPDELNSRIM